MTMTTQAVRITTMQLGIAIESASAAKHLPMQTIVS